MDAGNGNGERRRLVEHIHDVSSQLCHRFLQVHGDRFWAEIDLTMPQLKVLVAVVASSRVTMSQLARGLGITLSTATGIADRLVAQGFVRRESDPEDRRLVWLLPTEEGSAIVDRLTQAGQAHLSMIADDLSLEELSLVAQAQDLVYRALLKATGEKAGLGR